MWYRNVAADGPIENIKVDGQEAAPGDIVLQLNQKHIRKRFELLRKGSQEVVSISYDLIDSFTHKSEALVHLVNTKPRRSISLWSFQRDVPTGQPH